jgi:protein tyrosine/serine phosphatase
MKLTNQPRKLAGSKPVRKVTALLATFLVLCASLSLAVETNSPAIKIERPGMTNLHRVSAGLYRSAQPGAQGFSEIEKLGIKTVINLRAFHSDKDELPRGRRLDLKLEQINFNAWHPENEDVVRFLKIVTDTNRGPVLVHCYYGADRTGTMIAFYRMAVEGWTKQQAIAEMTGDRYGFHEVFSNLVHFIEKADVPALKKKAGLRSP